MVHQAFVSYSSQDKPIADAACAALEAKGIVCWIAPRDITPGIEYAEALIDAITTSRVFVLVLSASSNSSPQVLREVERAVSKGITIIPLRLDAAPLSKAMEYFVSSCQWLNAQMPPLEGHLERLAETIRRLLSGEEEPTPPEVEPASLASEPPEGYVREPSIEGKPVFVGRQHELEELDRFLERALARHGRVVFVTGEPGSGKTTLVQEFTRRSMEAHGDLAVALGRCNALSGIGDPYLPFIEILQMLTGDIEAEWLAGSLSQEHVRRLWLLLPEAVEALLTDGQELLDRLVPGEALLNRLHTTLGSAYAGLAHLRAILERKSARPVEVQQPYLFEQYTRVLQALARRRPLILVLDDLQWADTGSIGLLFHLGRRLEGYPILLIGAYRPEDVALGREGDPSQMGRHPLEPVVGELGRVYGPIHVDLDRADGQEFVEELLGSEPNLLGAGFHELLLRYAGGQPLFTLELLRGLQERGDLCQDEQGRWVEGPNLDWDRLPSRVEAVIGERIGRLSPELRETLSTASVEGETFTAQVIARVQDVDERTIIGRLSGPLSKEHRLVAAQSMSRVGGKPLSRYRFHHHLLQTYLYEHLDPVERAYLHGQVGDALREICAERPEALAGLAGQLVRHYREAGRGREASEYLHQAGGQAVRLSAPQEAPCHLGQALELAEEDEARDRILGDRAQLLLDLFRGREAAEDWDRLLSRARRGGDGNGQLQALLGLARAHYILALDAQDLSFASKSRELYEAAYHLARELGDKATMVRALMPTTWFVDFWPEYRDRVVANVREAAALSQEIGDEDLIADSSTLLLFRHQSLVEGARQGEELLVRLLKREDYPRAKELYFRLMWVHLARGNSARCVECCDAGIALAARIGVPPVQYPTLKGLALLRLGRYDAAREALQGEVADAEHPFGRAFQSQGMGVMLLDLGAYERAAAVFREVIEQAGRVGRAWLRAWATRELALSLVRTRPADAGRVLAIGQDLVNARDTAETAFGGASVLGEIALVLGNPEQALREAQAAAAEAQTSGARPVMVTALDVQARALLALDRPGEMLPLCEEGIGLATEIAYRPMEWRLRAARARALERLGAVPAAAQEYGRAAAIVRELAEGISDSELKRGFLADPEVTAVMTALS